MPTLFAQSDVTNPEPIIPRPLSLGKLANEDSALIPQNSGLAPNTNFLKLNYVGPQYKQAFQYTKLAGSPKASDNPGFEIGLGTQLSPHWVATFSYYDLGSFSVAGEKGEAFGLFGASVAHPEKGRAISFSDKGSVEIALKALSLSLDPTWHFGDWGLYGKFGLDYISVSAKTTMTTGAYDLKSKWITSGFWAHLGAGTDYRWGDFAINLEFYYNLVRYYTGGIKYFF